MHADDDDDNHDDDDRVVVSSSGLALCATPPRTPRSRRLCRSCRSLCMLLPSLLWPLSLRHCHFSSPSALSLPRTSPHERSHARVRLLHPPHVSMRTHTHSFIHSFIHLFVRSSVCLSCVCYGEEKGLSTFNPLRMHVSASRRRHTHTPPPTHTHTHPLSHTHSHTRTFPRIIIVD